MIGVHYKVGPLGSDYSRYWDIYPNFYFLNGEDVGVKTWENEKNWYIYFDQTHDEEHPFSSENLTDNILQFLACLKFSNVNIGSTYGFDTQH
jgi:hypothetical protein